MFLVALTRLGRAFDDVVRTVGQQLLEPDWEVRARLRGQPPWIVLCAQGRDDALRVLQALREQGHQAVAFDSGAVRWSLDMVSMRTFQLRHDGVVGHTPAGDPILLPFTDIGGIVRAVVGDQVVYFYRRSGEQPWLLRERGTSWNGLGARKLPEPHENLVEVVEVVRERSPEAALDVRLLESDLTGTISLLQHGRARHQPTQAPPGHTSRPPGQTSRPPALSTQPPPAEGFGTERRRPSSMSMRAVVPPGELRRTGGFGRLTVRPPQVESAPPAAAIEQHRRRGPGGAVWDEDATVRTAEPLGAPLIESTADPHTALRITTDVMAHTIALAHSRGVL